MTMFPSDSPLHVENIAFQTGISRFSNFFVKPFETWKRPKTDRMDTLKRSLARHVFCKYPKTPKLLEKEAWLEYSIKPKDNNDRNTDERKFNEINMQQNDVQKLYIDVVQGKSLYKNPACANLKLSRRDVFWLMQAPEQLRMVNAVWWARYMSLTNGNREEATYIATSPIPRAHGFSYFAGKDMKPVFTNAHFSCEVLHSLAGFFLRNRVKQAEMVDLLDYLKSVYQKTIEDGKQFTMKGRTLESIRDQSIRWHRIIAKEGKKEKMVWEPLGVLDWEFSPKSGHGVGNTYRIMQLVNTNQLNSEGDIMGHCVAAYASACKSGRCGIFSLRTDTKNLVTIEVDATRDQIVQARGRYNRSITSDEYKIIAKWADENRLSMGMYK